MKLKNGGNGMWPLARFIAPAYPEVNIFTRAASKTTPLGIVSVATAASKIWRWRVEIVDENNYTGPRNGEGLPDHARLQRERPAAVVGYYCGLSSTMDRVFELSKFYREAGAINIAGSWHAHYCHDEALDHNMDVVVHGDGDDAIRQILSNTRLGENLEFVPGISYRVGKETRSNSPPMLEVPNMSELPYPDFGLLRYGRKITTYPIGRVRGCRFNCEFCSVKGEPRWACAEHLFNTVQWLVDTRGARNFFIVDDRLEENIEGLTDFFSMIRAEYGSRLDFTVQIRLETARNTDLLKLMKSAGVTMVAIGVESPIDEDLKAMRKGYISRHMIEWVKILRGYFWTHLMFIFGYPHQTKTMVLGVEERTKRYKSFIRATKPSSIQVLKPVPLVGTDLRKRLEAEGRLFPLDVVQWSKYDGNYACFMPDDMTLEELQRAPMELMRWFYSSRSLIQVIARTLSFPIHYLVRGWSHWRYGWVREVTRYGAHRLIRKWHKRENERRFLSALGTYRRGR